MKSIALPEIVSEFQKARGRYKPKLPGILKSGSFHLDADNSPALPATDRDEINGLFPNTYGTSIVRIVEGKQTLNAEPMTVGVVLSGGPAPGGHNCIAGLFDALKAANRSNKLLGFLNGPRGIIEGNARAITAKIVKAYRNTGGFDMIATGRDKIESESDLARCRESLKKLGVNALVVIGGDDSNTNAAVLAEHFLAQKTGVQVIGLPKTIDGDMKTELIETSFGFDTAAKTFSELVGNICRDCISAGKYWHFIKLMGRAASHVALEVALQTQPNLTIISEEAERNGTTLAQIIDEIVRVVAECADGGKLCGVVVIPEGLLEFLPDFKALLSELGKLAHGGEKAEEIAAKLSPAAAKSFSSLPEGIRQVLLKRDNHGNIPVSQVETEKLLIDLVSEQISTMTKSGEFKGKFRPLGHFFGYEGRCGAPSNFDADYTYCLGYAAIQLIRGGLTGYTVFASNLKKSAEHWILGGVPVTSMLNMETRKGHLKPVIKKALVDLQGAPFRAFAAQRETWICENAYRYPGPVQYFGLSEVCDLRTETLKLEQSAESG